jgi:pilus assembly protein Flp/PilA
MLQQYTDLEVRVREFGRKVIRREEGASAVEYGLLVALIAVVIIAAVAIIGKNLNTKFSTVGNSLA